MIAFRTLRLEELPAWYAHCDEVFQDEADGYFQRHYESDPDADPALIFVAMDGDVIASTVRVFRREMWLSGRAVPMGGIGEVSTKPAYRKRGLASELLKHAIAAMEAEGMPLSVLFGNQRIYETHGWRFAPMARDGIPAAELPASCGIEIRPFRQEDLQAVMGLYDLYAGRLQGALLRREEYWRRWVLPQWKTPWVLMAEGRPLAYCVAAPRKDGPVLSVDEVCAAPQAEALLPAFIGALCRATGSDRAEYFPAILPGVVGEGASPYADYMVRVNIPVLGYESSGALAAAMAKAGCGVFAADSF